MTYNVGAHPLCFFYNMKIKVFPYTFFTERSFVTDYSLQSKVFKLSFSSPRCSDGLVMSNCRAACLLLHKNNIRSDER